MEKSPYRRKVDLPLGCLLALFYFFVLLQTNTMGFCRDEGYYFVASQRYILWVENAVRYTFSSSKQKAKYHKSPFARSEIEKSWSYNNEHPPLAKISMGATWWLFSKQLRWVSSNTGFRMAGMFWAALMILITYVWGVRLFNRTVGLFAALVLMLIPRFFFHAHLAAFDVPISALWLLVAYAFWRSLQSKEWGFWCGISFGLALATKHNAWILPGVLGLYWIFQRWSSLRFKVSPARGWLEIRLPLFPSSLWWSLFLGPLLFILLWPLLWPTDLFSSHGWIHTWKYIQFYVSFHLKHVHYDAYYFGKLFMKPPFPISFPFGMTLVTFPLVSVVLFLGGGWYLVRQQRLGSQCIWWAARLVRWFVSLLSPLFQLGTIVFLYLSLLFFGIMGPLVWLIEKILQLFSLKLAHFFKETFLWAKKIDQKVQDRLQKSLEWIKEDDQAWQFRPRPVGPADKTGTYWMLHAFIPMLIIALPSTPIFGGTKHWMPAWPFLALFAGIGFYRVQAYLERILESNVSILYRSSCIFLFVLFLIPSGIGLKDSHPFGLSYYNTLVGGPRGAANWKIQRQYWGYTVRQALPWMNTQLLSVPNEKVPSTSNVWVDFNDTNWDSYTMYLRDHLMSSRIKYSHSRWRDNRTRYTSFIHQKWLRNQLYHQLHFLNSRSPIHGVFVDNVPLMTLWEKKDNKPSFTW